MTATFRVKSDQSFPIYTLQMTVRAVMLINRQEVFLGSDLPVKKMTRNGKNEAKASQ
jgi:hypothetical protein